MPLEAIRYEEGRPLQVLDQLQLPHVETYDNVRTAEEGWHSIKAMRVRGAPAIAVVAALALAVEINDLQEAKKLSSAAEEVEIFINEKLDYLVTSRPTAVNLSDAAQKLKAGVKKAAQAEGATGNSVAEEYKKQAKAMLEADVQDNRNIGKFGADWIVEKTINPSDKGAGRVAILTHCNTGSLATAGHGTALGIIRSLHEQSALQHAYCTETRPYNQGSRLTAYELVHDQIPATLITDSMAAALMAKKEANVAAIVVGADRVAANGDTANKIGTYGLSVLARHHGVKFLVAAPLTTIDRSTKSGDDIVIEERAKNEVTTIRGPRYANGQIEPEHVETISIAAKGIDVWNPAFDVTPAALIDAVVTDRGVVEKGADGVFNFDTVFSL